LLSRDEVLTDREGRVSGKPNVTIAEGEFGEEFDNIVTILRVLSSE